MITQIPIDAAPCSTASATLFSSTISFQRLYGVTRSTTTNARMKITMPSSAKTVAASMFRSRSLMSFPSEEVRPPAVVRAIGAGVVAHGARRGLAFVGRQRAPAAVRGRAEPREHEAPVQQGEAYRAH